MHSEFFHIAYHDLIKIGLSIFFGGILGLERQYKHKTAGFRTIILICLGSALFTLVAQKGGTNVNANVITGIGFIGAGVIFKDGFSVSGLTTAAVIWISAAIGVATGTGDYTLAMVATALTICILSVFSLFEDYMNKIHSKKIYNLVFTDVNFDDIKSFESLVIVHHLKSERLSINKKDNNLQALIEVTGHQENINKLNEQLAISPLVKSF
ncbi:MgtC/SapB family protein [Mucilaginibacter robiniae]|uniref:MgtC/SapB family protein n=1 Tax=Mucilaginibacter robiniae TaxID=2728022 RepID=A0A7L5E215_9SPHI|nr:MgtC/SapB family protein [Mucilaginibacter robiniae]QJD96349.1 MgtC/SapB family protein [Mucilaginibacter robiniae]